MNIFPLISVPNRKKKFFGGFPINYDVFINQGNARLICGN